MSKNRATPTRWIRDRGVATKITGSVAIAVLVAVLVGIMGLQALSSTAARTTDMYEQSTKGVQYAEAMRFHYFAYRLASVNRSTATTPQVLQAATEQRDAAGVQFVATAEAMGSETRPTAEARALLDEVVADWDAYLELAAVVNAHLEAGRMAEYNDLRQNQIGPLSSEIVEDLQILSELQAEMARQGAAASKDAYASTRTTLIIAIAVGGVLALLAGIGVARSITGALNRVRRTAERLADGDLTQSTDVDQRDEVGRMAAALDAAQESLREVMSSVVASADAVAASSEELSASSAQISASAEETSAQSGVVASAAEEVSRNVQTVAAGAEQMGASIREIASNDHRDGGQAGRLVGRDRQRREGHHEHR
jgi:methyl-accepting chemotaxis protein